METWFSFWGKDLVMATHADKHACIHVSRHIGVCTYEHARMHACKLTHTCILTHNNCTYIHTNIRKKGI